MRNGKTAHVIIFALVLALAGGSAPLFSQQITALFGLGYHATDQETYMSSDNAMTLSPAIAAWTNVMFTGKSGLTVSFGYDTRFAIDSKVWNNRIGVWAVAASDTPIGIGYVKYDFLTEGAYFGGIFSALPRLNVSFEGEYGDTTGDVFLAPTLVAGYDLGPVTLGAQFMYMRGMFSGYNGFKFLVGAGVTFDFGSGPDTSAAAEEAYDAEEEAEPEPEPRTPRRR